MGSSWTRARTRVPCIGGQILNHCATREALKESFDVGEKTFDVGEGRLYKYRVLHSEKVFERDSHSGRKISLH